MENNKLILSQGLPVIYDATTLGITKRLTFKQAEQLSHTLERMSGSIQFWVGDFLNIAEKEFGEKYAQVIPEGESANTWRKYKWVCERISPDTRRKELSFTHHEIIAKMEPDNQAKWLQLAVDNAWTKTQLTDAIKAAEKKDDAPEADEEEKDSSRAMMKTICPKCGHEFQIGEGAEDGE